MSERTQIHFVSMEDPERAISNPALAGLLERGWSIVAHFVAMRDGGQVLALVLAPPRAHATSAERGHWLRLSLLGVVIAAVGGAVCALVQWVLI